MTSSLSQELMHHRVQLDERLARLEQAVNAQQADEAADPLPILEELSVLEDLQSSLTGMKQLVPRIDDLAEEALTELQIQLIDMGERLDSLNGYRSSIEEQNWSFLGERRELTHQGKSFDDKLRYLYLDKVNILKEKQSKGLTLHDAASEVESVLKGRIDILLHDAQPCQKEQLISFVQKTEQLHFRYFKEEFQRIQDSFTKDAVRDFDTLLPLIGPLNRFISDHTFVSDANKDELELLVSDIMTKLELIFQTQQTMEAYSCSDVEGESLAKRMNEELATIRLSLKPVIYDDPDTDLEFLQALELSRSF